VSHDAFLARAREVWIAHLTLIFACRVVAAHFRMTLGTTPPDQFVLADEIGVTFRTLFLDPVVCADEFRVTLGAGAAASTLFVFASLFFTRTSVFPFGVPGAEAKILRGGLRA